MADTKLKGGALLKEHPCPICGKTIFSRYISFEICGECGWEDDVADPDDPDDFTGANEMDVAEYREAYRSGWRPAWLKKKP